MSILVAPHAHQIFVLLVFMSVCLFGFCFRHFSNCAVVSDCDFIYISLVTDDTEQYFVVLQLIDHPYNFYGEMFH